MLMTTSVRIQSGSQLHSSNLLVTRKSHQNRIVLGTPSFPRTNPSKSNPKPLKISASSSSRTLDVKNKGENTRGGLSNTPERSRLVLKFVWMERNIGIALDQVIPGGHGTIPLSPYYFWPRKDAWEELKVMLESRPWISRKQMIALLNQATDIINLWQQGRN